MSGDRIFTDTNIIIYFLQGNKEIIEIVRNKDLVISFINELELLALPALSAKSEKIINDFLHHCLIIGLNEKIKKRTIEIRKTTKLKLPDSIVIATANYLKLPLLTADKQYQVVDDLELILYEP